MAGLSDLIVEQQEREIWARIQAAVAEERERCASIADDMRRKHGSATGDAYSNGAWDQGVRIAQKIRNIA